MKPTYELVNEGMAIRCLICGLTSHNAGDVRNRYCVYCHVFHEDLEGCPHCEEAVLPSERFEAMPHLEGGQIILRRWHIECRIRAIMGGLNHQMGLCSCCGGTLDPDPPGLTRRQAAFAAAEYFYKAKPRHDCP